MPDTLAVLDGVVLPLAVNDGVCVLVSELVTVAVTEPLDV